ncbi:hypothetical protein F4556_006637 [Kitasatospora gansuensis]|uniref:Uncharacterized protein n=1 Tax=Kitasatospora gansuensis TaxID=258050 RepID=A0A7W7WKR1_9ACTN|nr:hypothetical protein [Kitasatospora gansuensis]MBB4951102.1 hypothetical protein [Kitasatospora gansuensis]
MTSASPAPAAVLVTLRPLTGDECEVEVTSEQLHGRRCIGCGTDHQLVDAGHVYTPTGEAPLGWPVRSCARCMAAER